jgi:hypothetical protein
LGASNTTVWVMLENGALEIEEERRWRAGSSFTKLLEMRPGRGCEGRGLSCLKLHALVL